MGTIGQRCPHALLHPYGRMDICDRERCAIGTEKVKPYYEQDGITIYHGDCREVLPTLEVGSVNLLVTSPPYNRGMRISRGWMGAPNASSKLGRLKGGYGACDDWMDPKEYETFHKRILESCWSLLSHDGAIFYNHKPRILDGVLWTPLALNPGLPLRQIIIWSTTAGVNLMPGAFAPAHEWIMLFAKPTFKLTGMKASASGDVWVERRAPPKVHPAPFPVEIPSRCIRSTDAKTILDPFMGSGTTLRAAKDLGRKAVGIEIEEKYCEIAAKRLAQGVLFT